MLSINVLMYAPFQWGDYLSFALHGISKFLLSVPVLDCEPYLPFVVGCSLRGKMPPLVVSGLSAPCRNSGWN